MEMHIFPLASHRVPERGKDVRQLAIDAMAMVGLAGRTGILPQKGVDFTSTLRLCFR